jgi:hypothetical protein
MTRSFTLAVLLTGALVTTSIPTLAASSASASRAATGTGTGARADFDGDGFSDLAVGVPDEPIGDVAHAGSVNVFYGSSNGVTVTGDQLFTQASPGVAGNIQEFDKFGSALGVGDFNGDGYADLAIGVPGEDLGLFNNKINAGGVQVLYGSDSGLSADDGQFWSQGDLGIQDSPEDGDLFGSVLAAGDFDGDGFDDLAVGVPDEDVGNKTNAGAVTVIFGGSNGLAASGNQFWHQNVTGIPDATEASDGFGSALTAGDFDDDGFDDLAVGVPDEEFDSIPRDAGVVHVLYGAAVGLSAAGNQLWSQNATNVEGLANNDDQFGAALAAGDFDGDQIADLAIGVPGEDIRGFDKIGGVNVLYGTAGGGLSAANDQLWTQATPDVPGEPENDDRFGSALAAGDFDGDGFAELAVGVPNEDVTVPNSPLVRVDGGAVIVLPGTANGLTAVGSQRFAQDGTPDLLGTTGSNDLFGAALATGDFDGDGFWDLAVGVPNDSEALTRSGSVNVVPGSVDGLTHIGNKIFTQDTPSAEGIAEQFDHFGQSLG